MEVLEPVAKVTGLEDALAEDAEQRHLRDEVEHPDDYRVFQDILAPKCCVKTPCEHNPAGLTEHQISVIRLLAEGLSNEEVANELGVRPETVKSHLRKAFMKSDARNRTHLVVLAIKWGLVDLDTVE